MKPTVWLKSQFTYAVTLTMGGSYLSLQPEGLLLHNPRQHNVLYATGGFRPTWKVK